MRALATWCVRHRRLVAVFWISTLIVVTLISRSVGSAFNDGFSLPHTESTEAMSLLQRVSPKVSGDIEEIVFQTSGDRHVTDQDVETRITSMLAAVSRLPHVTSIGSPFGVVGSTGQSDASTQVSPDRTVAFATVTFDKQSQDLSTALAKRLVKTAKSADEPGLRVAVSGQLAEDTNNVSLGGTGLGVVLAGVVLLVVFGSVFAMVLPLVSALASLGTAVGVITLLSHLMRMPSFAPELVLLIGLGVGVDYALFIVTRHRQGLIAGHGVEESIVNAVDTSGRAVLFAGIIVCIALLGMFALGVTFLYGMAVAAAIGVAFTMIAAITFIPALLGFIGPKVLSKRQKKDLVKTGPRIVGAGTKGFWPRWACFVERRPVLPAVVALGIIVFLALPFFTMRLGSADQGNDAVGTTTRTAYDMLATGFGPGFNGPLQLVAASHDALDEETLHRLASSVGDQSGVARVAPAIVLPSKDGTHVALINVYPTTSPESAETSDLIYHLRSETIPSALAGSDIKVYVGGSTAVYVDFANVLSSKLPLFIGLVVLLSFLLLATVFRSIVIPLTAAAMNLLSIGAAFGIVVAVFQWGWLGGVFGVNRPGPVEAFVPVMLFAILFGLSMDYEVFLVSRIHEEYLKCGDNRTAVRKGLAATGKTITAAALIMILVFGSFILGGERVIKEFGLGLAAGILVDAVLIRMAIVPALMRLFGNANWWFPATLDRVLPRFCVDPDLTALPALPDPQDTAGDADSSREPVSVGA